MDNDNGTLAGLRDLLKKLHGDKSKPSVETSSGSTKNYAGGGPVQSMPEMDPNFMAQLNQGVNMAPPGQAPMPQEAGAPPLSEVASSLNQIPDTDYNFYKGMEGTDRKALYDRLTAQQKGPQSIIAQGLGGLGDAIANSFGGQHTTFQKDIQGAQNQRKEQELTAFDTQRSQKLQDMQGGQEMQMNDPNSPLSRGMRDILKSKGINPGSKTPASILVKIFPALGEMALKEATLAQGDNQFNTSAGQRKEELARQAEKDKTDAEARAADQKRAATEAYGKQGIVSRVLHPEVAASLKDQAGLASSSPLDPTKQARLAELRAKRDKGTLR